MKISGETTIAAPRERVWELLNDPNRLSRLIPGLEKLETVGPDSYAGTINVGIAAVKGTYSGTLKLEDKRAPEHYKMVIDGKGRQGFMRGTGTIDLVAKDSATTTLRYVGDVQIGGALMQVGQRMIDSAAKMMLGQFFAAAEADLQATAVGTTARQGILINLWRSILRAIRSLFSRG
jgi:carbon monoxide dehydrogenase subunit G